MVQTVETEPAQSGREDAPAVGRVVPIARAQLNSVADYLIAAMQARAAIDAVMGVPTKAPTP